MTLQADSLPHQIVTELEREPDTWFRDVEIPVGGTMASIKRALHRLVNEKYIVARVRDVGTFDEPKVINEYRYATDEARADQEAETRAKRKRRKPVVKTRLPATDGFTDPYDYALEILGDTEHECPKCGGTGKLSKAPTKGEISKSMGIAWNQFGVRDLDRTSLKVLRMVRDTFNLASLEAAADLLLRFEQMSNAEQGEA